MAGVRLERDRRGRDIRGAISKHGRGKAGDFSGRGDRAALVPSRERVVLSRRLRDLVAVEVHTNPTFSLGRSVALFPAAGFSSLRFIPQDAVALDDPRFLMIRPLQTGAPDKLIVVENWFEELRTKSRK